MANVAKPSSVLVPSLKMISLKSVGGRVKVRPLEIARKLRKNATLKQQGELPVGLGDGLHALFSVAWHYKLVSVYP